MLFRSSNAPSPEALGALSLPPCSKLSVLATEAAPETGPFLEPGRAVGARVASLLALVAVGSDRVWLRPLLAMDVVRPDCGTSGHAVRGYKGRYRSST